MKRIFLAGLLFLSISTVSFAQQMDADAPASKEDVQKYLEIMHSREMIAKMTDAMLGPMHQMMHEQFLKDRAKLPPDFESRITKEMDDFLRTFPFDEMLQAMVPVYQKHFTKNDMDNLVAFYSTPTGQKLIQELPAISAESMQTMLPLVQRHVEVLQSRIQQQVAQMIKESQRATGSKSQATPK